MSADAYPSDVFLMEQALAVISELVHGLGNEAPLDLVDLEDDLRKAVDRKTTTAPTYLGPDVRVSLTYIGPDRHLRADHNIAYFFLDSLKDRHERDIVMGNVTGLLVKALEEAIVKS